MLVLEFLCSGNKMAFLFCFERDENSQGILTLFSVAISFVMLNAIKAVSLVRNENIVSTTIPLHRKNDAYLY